METKALSTVAMGNDAEHWLTTGGNDRLVAAQRRQIIDAAGMRHTAPMPEELIRWRFPRYALPVGGASFYYDISDESDLLEIQTPECATPFQLAASQELTRQYFRRRLPPGIALGACGYVRSQPRFSTLRFAGSHLNVSVNSPSLPGFRTALASDDARQAMLYLLSTCQVWGGLGMHFAPDWEVRSRVIRSDISNDCISNKGILQPGREIPSLEVKETETYHYTHYEAGWARSAYQRALAAATVAIDAHLGCHHTGEVLAFLRQHSIPMPPPQSWHGIRAALSASSGEQIHRPVTIGERGYTHLELLEMRLALYERLISDYERTEVPWVAWTVDQLTQLRLALQLCPQIISGPLLGLDAVVKNKYLFEPLVESQGFTMQQIWDVGRPREAGVEPPSEELVELQTELFGLNLLYHDFGLADGPYEQLMQAHPEIESRQQVAQVQIAAQESLPTTRSRRRHRLMEAYAAVSEASGGRLVPCFAGFNRIGVKIGEEVHNHALGPVLHSTVTQEDWNLVRRHAHLVGVDAERVLESAHV